jgi:hypothetical protein
MLLLFSIGGASAVSATLDRPVVTGARTVLSGEPGPTLTSETTAVSGIVRLPSTSTASTGPDVFLALLVLGLAGTAGAFAVARRRRSP